MEFQKTGRAARVRIVTSIVLLLTAMLLPVCHLHPLLNPAAPDHCAICVSLHAAAPVGPHAPCVAASLMLADQVVVADIQERTFSFSPRLATRAPPLAA